MLVCRQVGPVAAQCMQAMYALQAEVAVVACKRPPHVKRSSMHVRVCRLIVPFFVPCSLIVCCTLSF